VIKSASCPGSKSKTWTLVSSEGVACRSANSRIASRHWGTRSGMAVDSGTTSRVRRSRPPRRPYMARAAPIPAPRPPGPAVRRPAGRPGVLRPNRARRAGHAPCPNPRRPR
jgi:hypothetical protein